MCIKELRIKSAYRKNEKYRNKVSGVRIWAHRGCSYKHVENTVPAFVEACTIEGIEGLELDVQLSKDGEIMVFHDENLKRLTGNDVLLKDRTAKELQNMKFLRADTKDEAEIPTLREVFVAVKPYLDRKGLLINIELKNSDFEYLGMEEKVVTLVREFKLTDNIIYSSFNGNSLDKIKKIEPEAKVGILKTDVINCERFAKEHMIDALHPSVKSVLKYGTKSKLPVRAWNVCEPFYGEKKRIKIYDLWKLKKCGITDIITNYPELYIE